MVLVDTSVWISLYRKENAEAGRKIWTLSARNEAALSGQVWVEFLGEFRKESLRREFEKKFRSFPFLETTREAYEFAARLLALHPRLGAGDAIIGATAISTKSALWTLDRDFEALISDGLELF